MHEEFGNSFKVTQGHNFGKLIKSFLVTSSSAELRTVCLKVSGV